MSALFSIITVTKDNLDGLKKTAQSVQAQNDALFEWIIIDGNSDDGTKNYLKNLNAITLSEKDSGIYDAMNKGINQAAGFYSIFMNAGDVFAASDILDLIALDLQDLQKTPAFIYGESLEASQGGAPHNKPAKPYTKIKYGMFTHHQAMIYRTDRLKDLRYNTNYKIAADYDLTLRFLKGERDVYYIPAPLCIFESGGISQSHATKGRREQFEIRKAHKTVSKLENCCIYAAQKCLWSMRAMAPRLYWRLKSSGSKGGDRTPS
jgi:putative colanic acid biosynthesis glycosyltransferase